MMGTGFEVVSKYGEDRFPEHAKLTAISDQSQAIGEFVDWLQEAHGAFLCHYEDDGQFPRALQMPIRKLLAEFFEIDQDKIEDEKRAMLDTIRADNRG